MLVDVLVVHIIFLDDLNLGSAVFFHARLGRLLYFGAAEVRQVRVVLLALVVVVVGRAVCALRGDLARLKHHAREGNVQFVFDILFQLGLVKQFFAVTLG